MDRFDAMRAFTRIVERRSFTQAAEDLLVLSVVTGLVGQGLSILDTLRHATAPAASNGRVTVPVPAEGIDAADGADQAGAGRGTDV